MNAVMQGSTVQSGPPVEVFQGLCANHAVLFTPRGLVYLGFRVQGLPIVCIVVPFLV